MRKLDKIRKLGGFSYAQLGKILGVSRQMIDHVINGRAYYTEWESERLNSLIEEFDKLRTIDDLVRFRKRYKTY